jgi:hypothetical protein
LDSRNHRAAATTTVAAITAATADLLRDKREKVVVQGHRSGFKKKNCVWIDV